MRINEAKNIQILDFLKSVNIFPQKIVGGQAYFNSPGINQNSGSLTVNLNENIWFDHLTGKGGDIINLANLIFQSDTKSTLKKLDQLKSKRHFFFNKQKNIPEARSKKEGKIKLNKISNLKNEILIEYLINQRKIPLAIGREYLFECLYTVNSRKYFAIAFPNNKGGFELRNPVFKNAISPKAISFIKGHNKEYLNIFEGFIDFLSALVFFKMDQPTNDTIILNSTALIPQISSLTSQYSNINCFLDNDQAGDLATKLLQQENQIIDRRYFFQGYKDFNEFLIKG